jgi:hypothetical protein
MTRLRRFDIKDLAFWDSARLGIWFKFSAVDSDTQAGNTGRQVELDCRPGAGNQSPGDDSARDGPASDSDSEAAVVCHHFRIQ